MSEYLSMKLEGDHMKRKRSVEERGEEDKTYVKSKRKIARTTKI